MGLTTPAHAGVFCECLCYEPSQKTGYQNQASIGDRAYASSCTKASAH